VGDKEFQIIARSTEKSHRTLSHPRSEVNLADALPHTPRVGLRKIGRFIRNLPRFRADDGQSGSYSESAGSLCAKSRRLSPLACVGLPDIWARPFRFYLPRMLLRCQTPTPTKQQAARNKTSLSRKDVIGVDFFPQPRPTETNCPVIDAAKRSLANTKPITSTQ